MHEITTQLEFCYGHRIQNHAGKCRWLHGHNGLLQVSVSAESLDEYGMIMDFAKLREAIKDWLDYNMEHAMILAESDPLTPVIKEHEQRLYAMANEPTAENMLVEIYQGLVAAGIKPSRLQLWETAKNCASYVP